MSSDRPIPNSYTVAPGQLYAGEYPGASAHTPTHDLTARLASFLDAGITVFIDLTEALELDDYVTPLSALAESRGIAVVHERHPIRDFSTTNPGAMRLTLDAIDAHHAAGRAVYVHCWGGVGRTGMTIGCWLVRHGHTPAEALARVSEGFDSMQKRARMRNRTSPESADQIRVVEEWQSGA